MVRFTGMSRSSHLRLERGEMSNPPLRDLVNRALVLSRRLQDDTIGLFDIVEDDWLEWMPFDQHAAATPPYPRPGQSSAGLRRS